MTRIPTELKFVHTIYQGMVCIHALYCLGIPQRIEQCKDVYRGCLFSFCFNRKENINTNNTLFYNLANYRRIVG